MEKLVAKKVPKGWVKYIVVPGGTYIPLARLRRYILICKFALRKRKRPALSSFADLLKTADHGYCFHQCFFP